MSKELIERLRNAAIFATSECAWLMTGAADALEAKAAPAGEWEAYEAWKLSMKPYGFDGFDAYQAGAAYQRAQPQSEYGDAYQGSREDLAIWKRRALEAESRIREQDQIIENLGNALNAENGPTFMGEPVIQQPQSEEAVAYTTAGMLAIAKELPLTGRIGARCKADDRWNVPLYTAPQPSAAPDAITMADVMRAWEYAEDHPHKYLRGTTNWCAAMAYSLNQQRVAAPSAPKADPVKVQLLEALECVKQAGFDCGNDGWGVIHLTNDDWQIALAAIAAARKGEGE